MRLFLALLALFTALPAFAADVHRLTWDISIDGQKIGTRKATITVDQRGDASSRVIESMTDIDAKIGPVSWAYKQRLTVFAEKHPAAFHAVIKEDGKSREVQARWSVEGWTVSLVDAARTRTFQAAPHRIDLSTADLIDPGTRHTLGRADKVRLLSAETGEVFEGEVVSLGAATVDVAGKPVHVEGWSWTSPVGKMAFWYDSDGWLVKYQTTVVGREIQGVLRTAPPPSPDAFSVNTGPELDAVDL